MIRGSEGKVLLLALLLVAANATSFQKIEITKAHRVTTLSGSYPSENIKISFVANQDGINHFTYLMPLEYDQKINKISFTKSEKDRTSLTYTKSFFSYEGQSYAKYRIQLPYNHQIGDIGDIYIHAIYLYRYENLPASITLTEDQKLQYEDVKFLVSPYHIVDHESHYKFARIYQHDPDGSKKGNSEVHFNKGSIDPFTKVKHNVFGVNNNAQVQFTSVVKTIDVSHWGNVGIVENYKIVNKGPSLKGQFSRVTFGSKGYDIKNAFKGIDFDLPYQIWGLYYLDEVGNISTSKAYRDDASDVVRVSLMPRFSLLGGWKSNWELGYNLNTNGHLYRSGNQFQLRNVKLQYALERVQTENFMIKIILPDGVNNVRIKIGGKQIDSSKYEVGKSEGYLDFNGKPTFIIPNYQGWMKDKEIEVNYEYAANRVYQKLIILSGIVFGILCFAILLKRFKLEAFAESKEE